MSSKAGTSPVGKWSAHVQINGAGQSGPVLVIKATKGDVFKFEDIFTIEGVHDVELRSERKRFLVLETMVAKGNGLDILKIMPAIVGPDDKYPNVDALPANGAILEWLA